MEEGKKGVKKENRNILLDAGGIDEISELVTGALGQTAADRKDIVRVRLAIEDILALWQSELAPGTVCAFRQGSRMGRPYIHLLAEGKKSDPNETREDESGGLMYSGLLAQAGLSLIYTYKNNQNCLSLYPPKAKRFGTMAQLLIAIGAALLVGLLSLSLPQRFHDISAAVVDPLFTAMMGVLQALAGPMIFLSVCWGIISIGDIGVMGKIGKTVIVRFLVSLALFTSLTALCLIWLFDSGGGTQTGSQSALSQIYHMILGIIPTNIFSPFLEGNSLQIIFLGICVGLVMLILKEKVFMVNEVMLQSYTVIQFMMETVSRYMPFFTFVSLFSLITSNALDGLGGVMKGIFLAIAVCVIWPLVYALAVCIRLKVSFPVLLKKLLPTYLIALTTASSAATLSVNLETCERKLGISSRISSFAVPLGQVVFKVGAASSYFLIVLGLGEFYGVSMPLPWIITGVAVSVLLAVASPPVPGGSLTCYTVLLGQMGIPDEGIALAIAGNIILDFFMTSCGISCLQSELVLSANRLDMLDKDVLRNKEQKK